MAQIPTVTAPELTPPPEINPGMAGAPGLAMARAAQQMMGADEYAAQVADRVAQAQDEGLALAAKNSIDADIEKAHAQLANWTDYTHAAELKQQTADDLLRKYGDQYSDKPYLWRAIQPYLERELNAYNAQVDVTRAKLIANFNRGALDESVTRLSNQAASALSPQEREKSWAEADAEIDAMARNGSITFEEAAAKKIGMRATTELAEIRQALNPLNPPEAMQAELEKIKQHPEMFKEIPAAELATLQDRLGIAYREAQERSDTREIRARVNLASGRLQAIYGDDYDGMLKAVGEPATQKSLGLTDKNGNPDTQAIDELRTYLGGQDAIAKKTEADANQRALDKLSADADDLKLSDQQIDDGTLLWKTNPQDPNAIPPFAAEKLKELRREAIRFNHSLSVQERAQKTYEDSQASTEQVARLGSQPGFLTRDDIPALMQDNPGLKYSDALRVVEMRSMASDSYFQSALDVFKQAANSQIIDMADYGKAQIALLQAAQRGTAGSDLIKFADNLMQPQVKKQIEQKLDQIVNQPVAPGTWQRGAPYQTGRFNPNITVQGAEPALPAGATQVWRKDGKVVGWTVNGNYVSAEGRQ